MATPFDLYIRFLVTKGLHDLKDVNLALEELNLAHITQACYDGQYELIKKTLPKGVWDQIETQVYEGDYLKWMRILEVEELWKGEKKYLEPTFKRTLTVVTGIHDDPQLRLCINGLLIKGLRGKDVYDNVNTRFSCMLKEDHIKLYQKYFFDPQRMTRRDWKVFLRTCAPKEINIYFTALTEPLDILKTELELPAEVNPSESLQFLLTKSFMKARQYLELSTKEANAEARAWISQVANLTDKYMKYKSADTRDFAKTLQMQFEFVDNDFPTPDSETLQQLQEQITLKEQ
jgi:hypothetical protein